MCPLRGKCFQCKQEGHLSRDCPERAGYRAGDEETTEVRDPTPAEEAALVSVSAASRAVSSAVDLRDNQLNELSQSQSILGPVLAGVSPISLPVEIESDEEFSDASEHPAPIENNVVINKEMSSNVVVNNKMSNNEMSSEMNNNEVVNSVNNTAVE